MTTDTTPDRTPVVGNTVHVAPTTLLLQRNIREAKPSPALIKSVRDLGVLQPIVAVLTGPQPGDTDAHEAPQILVRFGHRRTLAAIEANCETVPVYIAGVDGTAQAAEVLRIISQRDENTHRDALTTSDEIGVVEALTGLGLSAAQVAKQARMKRAQVEAALTVAGSTLARKATDRYDALTLDQAAVVADFEDDPETVKALIVAAHEGHFEHAAQQARDERAKATVRAELIQALDQAGVTIIERPSYDSPTTALDRLRASAEGDLLDADSHHDCPGHLAWISHSWTHIGTDGQPVTYPDEPDHDAGDEAWETYESEVDRINATARNMAWPTVEYGCKNPRTYGHHDRYGTHTTTAAKAEDMSEEEREAAKKARALVIENNKRWQAAEAVRREWVANLATRKVPPKGTATFIATALSHADNLDSVGGNALAAQWLSKNHTGYGRTDLTPSKTATENRALVIALVQVLAAYEADLTKDSWRRDGTHNSVGRYLRFLHTCGYPLEAVEKFAVSKKTA